jgi:hypothetical protein
MARGGISAALDSLAAAPGFNGAGMLDGAGVLSALLHGVYDI